MKVYIINHYNEYDEYPRLLGVVEENELNSALEQIKKECKYNDEDMEAYIDIQEVELNELDI